MPTGTAENGHGRLQRYETLCHSLPGERDNRGNILLCSINDLMISQSAPITYRSSRQSLEGASSTRKGIFVASFVVNFVALFALPRQSLRRGSRQSLEGASSTRKGIFVASFVASPAKRDRLIRFLYRSSLRRSSRLSLERVFQFEVETTKFATRRRGALPRQARLTTKILCCLRSRGRQEPASVNAQDSHTARISDNTQSGCLEQSIKSMGKALENEQKHYQLQERKAEWPLRWVLLERVEFRARTKSI